MLAILFLHIIISLASLFAGYLLYYYVIRDNDRERAGQYRPVIFYLITGLIVLTLLTQLFILVLPASIFFRAGLLILLIILTIATKKKTLPFVSYLVNKLKHISLPANLAFAVAWCMILVLNAGPTMMDDTDSYHIQMIKWIQEYGTVPGLANLHRRFGFNSSWFSSVALFSFEWKGHNFFTTLNGLLSVWFAGYLLSVVAGKNNKIDLPYVSSSRIAYFFVFAIALIAWPVIRGNPASANYDFIALLITFVLFSELFLSLHKKNFGFTCEWIIWPVFLFTIRIINFPLLLLSLFAFIPLLRQRQWRQLTFYFLICILLIVPFLIRNVIISGYPFYPALYFDWFNVDWKASKEKTSALLDYIKYYNRVSTGFYDLDKTASLGFPEWIVAWFKYMLIYNKIMLIPGLTGIFLSPLFLRKTRLFTNPAMRIFLFTIVFQIIVWFVSAPDPRFVYGCLFAGILMIALMLRKVLAYFDREKVLQALLITTAIIIATFTLYKPMQQEQYRNWALPAKIPSPPVKNITIDHIEMHIPENILTNWNPRCYATELPCLYEPDSLLHARGETIADGFKLKK